MEKKIQPLLDKYQKISIDSIKFENGLSDIEKSIIFENESQVPNLVLNSSYPFDKNYCFYDITLTASIEENIYPKQKYYLKSLQTFELRQIDVNKIFDDDKLFKNPEIISTEEKKELKEDDKNVQNQILSSIKNNHYKSYIPKNKNNLPNNNSLNANLLSNNSLENQIDNEWLILGDNIKEGPFNDYNMYKKLYQIFIESKDKKFPNYIVNERISDIFMTMEECFQRLKNKFDNNQSKISNNNQYMNKILLQNMNNMIFYRNQMIQYTLMNQMLHLNYLKNKNMLYNNKNSSPNKFDNNYYLNNNSSSNVQNSIKESNNNHQNNKKQNVRGRNKFNNNNFHNKNNYRNKYNKKEKRFKDNKKDNENDKIKDNYDQNKNEIDNSQNTQVKNEKQIDENKTKINVNDFFK